MELQKDAMLAILYADISRGAFVTCCAMPRERHAVTRANADAYFRCAAQRRCDAATRQRLFSRGVAAAITMLFVTLAAASSRAISLIFHYAAVATSRHAYAFSSLCRGYRQKIYV